MKKIAQHFKKSESGQVAVEYVLLIAVMSSLIFGLLGKVKDSMLPDPDACESGVAVGAGNAGKPLGCAFINVMNTLGTSDGGYRYFTLRK